MKEDGKKQRNFIASALAGLIMVPIVRLVFPSAIPFSFWEFWQTKGTPQQWLMATLPVLLWGITLQSWCSLSTKNPRHFNDDAESLFKEGLLISVRAGVVEEMAFRWLIFLNAIPGIKITNWFLFGFLGWGGLSRWVQLYLVGPVANFFTAGFLAEYLLIPETWAVGGAMLMSNAFFRDGHKYQGWLGYVDSWFFGMYMFYLLFTCGLPCCILVHLVYDVLIFAIVYLDCVIERWRAR